MLPMRRGFTLLQLLVILVIAGMLAVLLFPVFAGAKAVCDYRRYCIVDARKLGRGLGMYVQDYDQHLPPAASGAVESPVLLPGILDPYTRDPGAWHCADAPRKPYVPDVARADSISFPVDRGYNWLALSPEGAGIPISLVREPALTVALVEGDGYLSAPSPLLITGTQLPRPTPLALTTGTSPPVARHEGSVRVIWLDGHVSLMKPDQLEVGEGGAGVVAGIDAFRHWNLR